MGTELLEVGETYECGYKPAVALAKRAVKNTMVEPVDLIMAMFRHMVESNTLVHVVNGETLKLLDCIAPFPDPDEKKVKITVPMPQKTHLMIIRDVDWDMLRSLMDMIEYERAAHAMPHAQYVPLNPKRLIAAGFRFWALTRTVGWKHPVGLMVKKTEAEHRIVRKPRKVHAPVVKGDIPPLERRSLFAPKR